MGWLLDCARPHVNTGVDAPSTERPNHLWRWAGTRCDHIEQKAIYIQQLRLQDNTGCSLLEIKSKVWCRFCKSDAQSSSINVPSLSSNISINYIPTCRLLKPSKAPQRVRVVRFDEGVRRKKTKLDRTIRSHSGHWRRILIPGVNVIRWNHIKIQSGY